HRQRLRDDQQPVAIPSIDEDARKRRERHRRDLSAEPDDAEEEFRSGEAIDQPARGDAGDPGADERDALAAEEETVVAMSKRACEPGQRADSTQVSLQLD